MTLAYFFKQSFLISNPLLFQLFSSPLNTFLAVIREVTENIFFELLFCLLIILNLLSLGLHQNFIGVNQTIVLLVDHLFAFLSCLC